MRTKQQYIEGLRKMRRNIYVNGEKIARDDEMQMPTINTIGITFDYAADPKHQDLCTATSHLTGEKINRFHPYPSKQGRPAQEAGYDPPALPGGRGMHPAVHGDRRLQRHLQCFL